ncbi:MAG: DUF4870 domain-containing protein, partial [Nocardioides sp.]
EPGNPYGEPQRPPEDQPDADPPPASPAAPPEPQYGAPPVQPGQPPYGQPPYGQHPQPYAGPGAPLTPDERTWGGAAHWSALVGAFVALAFLGPLIVMITKGNESAYIRRQAVESLNFQLSMLIYAIVAAISLLLLVGLILLPIVGLLWLIFTIIGSVKAANGEEYRYPLTIRLVT